MYRQQIETFIKACINHITKVEFFLAFHAAYKQSITPENAKAGFCGAGLVPFNPNAVLSKLDVKLQTPTPTAGFCGAGLVPFNPNAVLSKLDVKLQTPIPTGPSSADANPWVSQTPRNPTDALSQTTLVKSRIAGHQGSLPTPIFATVAALAKGTEILAHEMTLLSAEVRTLRAANEALSKCRRAKKTRVRQGGVLTVGDAQDLLAQRDVDEQVQCNLRSEGSVFLITLLATISNYTYNLSYSLI
ncbi:hypothetical protein V502_00295, partial [Pseudogymnoascus sp. VKM F-4520 (FW-2644)]